MAENVKGLAMRYKHDGVVYELDSGKLVHTKGEQSIDGKKVFTAVPQVEGAPVEDNDVTNKKYVQDALDAFAAPKVASFTITATNRANAAQGAAPVEINKLKIFLADGRRLDPVFMEEGDLKGSTEAKLLVLTLNKQDQSDLTPTKVAKTEIESYALKDGEFLGKLYPCKFFGQHQDMYSNSGYQDPWNQYWTKADRFWDQESTTSGQVRIDVFDIDQMVQKLTFTSTSSGREAVFTATANDGAKEENGDVQKKENHVFDIVFPKMGEMLSKPGPVLLSTNQVVKDVKTFATPPKSANAPVADDDVVNKAYVDENFISASGFQMEKSSVTGLVKGSNKGGSYCGFSYFKWLLKDGTRLDLKMVENVTANNATTPVLAVWHVVKDLGAQITAPEKKSKAEIEGYQLQEGEFKGTLSYFKVVGKYNVYTGEPWDSYIGSGITGQHEGLLGFAINDLVSPLKAIEFTVGNKGESWQYAFDTLQVTGKNGSKDYDVTYPKKAVNNEVVTVELPFSSVPDFVTVQNEQTITGVKNFDALPVSKVKPTEDNQLTNKKYVDSVLGGGYDVGVTISQAYDTAHTAWGGVSKLHLKLASGVLEAKYVEETMPADAKEPALVVWVLRNEPTNNPTVEYKSKEELKAYELQDDEFFGDITYANLLGPYKSHTSTSWRCPFDTYLYNGGALGQQPIIRVNVNELNQAVKSVCYYSGHDGAAYVAKDDAVEFVVNKVQSDSTVTGTGTDTPFNFSPKVTTLFDSKKYKFVPIEGDANIFDVKTFSKPPKCLADAVDDNDLVTKAYVDSKSSSVDKLPVQEITVFTKAASNNTILMNYLLLDTVDGTHVDPIYYEKKTAYNNLQEPLRVIFSVNAKRWVSSSYTSVSPTEMETRDMDSYVLKDGEFMGSISLPNLVSGGKVNFVGTSDNLPWFHLKVTTRGATEDTPIFKIKIEGKLPAVAKASFQADTTYPGEDFKLAVAAGGITKESEVKRAVAGAVLNLTCTEVPIYEDYYVNTVANQSIMGTKVFKSAPQYLNLAPVARNNGDNLVNFANLASSIGVAVPEKQCIALTADAKQTKHNNGSTNYMYSWSITVWFQNLVPAFIDPLTGKITPLYIKHYCTDGRAILTTTKPSVEFDKGSVTSKSTSEMDSYTLAKGEYLCKAYWYFLNQRANIDVNGSYIKKNDICGAKVLDLFTNTSSAWREYTTPQSKDASSNIAPSSQVIVEFYNTPEIRYVRAYGSGVGSLWIDHYPFGLAERDSAAQIKSTSAAYNSSEFQEFGAYYRDYFALNAPTSPVEMLPVAPIVANMQATIEKLEARIKTLEDAVKP